MPGNNSNGIDPREKLTMNISKDSLLKELNIDAEAMYDKVINPVLNAGTEGMTYGEKVLKLIESSDILPNEEAFLVVTGIQHLFLMMEQRDSKGGCDGDCNCGD